ncbi:hypothetical protein SDC9_84368 [bioreactor metagenome]|uniref:Uncharacterized protein n=1 Tax=bioreactor metagenome TaxID=1076179 RepID=A0A644ZAM4_9ZZZZ
MYCPGAEHCLIADRIQSGGAFPIGEMRRRIFLKPIIPRLFFEQPAGEIAFAGIGQQHGDGLTGIFRSPGQLDAGKKRGAAGDSDQQSFLAGGFASGMPGVLGGYRDHFVDQFAVENFGNEIGADALQFVRTGMAAGEQRRVGGFDGDDLDFRTALLEIASDAGQGAAGADPGDEGVDLACAILPEFGCGTAEMGVGIGRGGKLLGNESAGMLGLEFQRGVDRALHAFGARRQDQLRTVGGQQFAPLDAHGFRHGQDELVALDRGGEGQADAGVAAGGFDDQGSGREFAVAFGGFDHGQTDPVLDAAAGIEKFDFGQEFGSLGRKPVDPHQRSVADGAQDAGVNVHGDTAFPSISENPVRRGGLESDPPEKSLGG